ncbi:efflux transporter outer membrane subunit [Marinobacterium sp. AK62]|uniref:Efflux transporter outer membrane subunit n=1 Tax=Marinobacterium alkalitolerans TaxID=1542925 RepID=A0ABS3Z816_9GAMM|nr:efflux transporter outer membrane subunit [Marinobacterium alkalitolerans]MBP0047861.1 efflux transporter outer membrane subunit [Marinobacterium alkalitolerans]
MRVHLMLPFLAMLTACSAPPSLAPPSPELPSSWSTSALSAEPMPGWLTSLNDPVLEQLVSEALAHNPSLAAQREAVAAAVAALSATDADRFPALSLELGSRRQEDSDAVQSLDLSLSWTPDLWGELDARSRQAALQFAAEQAALDEAREALVAEVSQNWFKLQEAQMLLALYTQRRDNLQQNLEIIESNYRQGLSEALDLYLARNNVNEEAARVEQQQQALGELKRSLEQALGRYPSAALSAGTELPLLEADIPAGLPADILRRRPDLQQAWLNLMASDAALAAAHRDRFPALTLSGSYGGSSDTLSNLVSSGNLAWTLGASLVQTLFDAGRKEAVQDQALSARREQEQRWLEAVFAALVEVENALSARTHLQARYQLYLKAEKNALNAEQLAFERYRNGLESFTTVLEAQRRSLDAQTSVINLRQQLLTNRIELYRALGGRFSARMTAEPETDAS